MAENVKRRYGKADPPPDPESIERIRWTQVVRDAGLGTASIPMLMRAAKALNLSLVRMITTVEMVEMVKEFQAEDRDA